MTEIKLPITCSEAWHMLLITGVILTIIPVLIDPTNWGVLIFTALLIGVYGEIKLLQHAEKHDWHLPTISCRCDND